MECSHAGRNEADVLFSAMVDCCEPLPDDATSLLSLIERWRLLASKGDGCLPRGGSESGVLPEGFGIGAGRGIRA